MYESGSMLRKSGGPTLGRQETPVWSWRNSMHFYDIIPNGYKNSLSSASSLLFSLIRLQVIPCPHTRDYSLDRFSFFRP